MNRNGRFNFHVLGWLFFALCLTVLSGYTREPAFARLPPPVQGGDTGGEGTPYEEPELNTPQRTTSDGVQGTVLERTDQSAGPAAQPTTREPASGRSRPETSPAWLTRFLRTAASWWWLVQRVRG